MSSTHKSKSVLRIPEPSLGKITLPDCAELCRRLSRLRLRRPAAEPGAQPIRIGTEDPYGDLTHVVQSTRLTEAVKVFETLADFGLVPGHGRSRACDARSRVRTYRQPSK